MVTFQRRGGGLRGRFGMLGANFTDEETDPDEDWEQFEMLCNQIVVGF